MINSVSSISNNFNKIQFPNILGTKQSLTSAANSQSEEKAVSHSSSGSQSTDKQNVYKTVRKLIAWILPVLAMSSLGLASLLSKGFIIEALSEPIAEFLSFTSLVVIISDMVATILPGVYEAFEHIKSCIEHPSLKGTLYILSKLVPLHAMAALLIGNKYLGRIQSRLLGSKLAVIQKDSIAGKYLSKQKVFPSINELASFVESVKARTSDLGGGNVASSVVRDFIRTQRAKILKEHVAPWITVGAKNKNSKAFQMPVLAMGTFLMSVWENLRVGATDVLLKVIAQFFPENSPFSDTKKELELLRV